MECPNENVAMAVDIGGSASADSLAIDIGLMKPLFHGHPSTLYKTFILLLSMLFMCFFYSSIVKMNVYVTF